MKRTIFTILLSAGIFATSDAQNSEVRSVSEFDAIRVSHGIEVILVDGAPGDVKVMTRNVDPDNIYAEVERGMLKIKFRNSSIWNWSDRSNKNRDIKVEVPFRELIHVEVNTGGMIRTEKVIRTEGLEFEATTGGEADIEIDVDHLMADITMGSVIEINGRAESQRTKISMGAVVDFSDLESEVAYVKSNMGAELKVKATKEIDASAGMGGVIFVYGSPERQYTSRSMGGEIDFHPIN